MMQRYDSAWSKRKRMCLPGALTVLTMAIGAMTGCGRAEEMSVVSAAERQGQYMDGRSAEVGEIRGSSGELIMGGGITALICRKEAAWEEWASLYQGEGYSEEDSLSIEDFWEAEDIGSVKNGMEKGVKFATGLEIVFPDIWRGKVELETDANTLAVCEKGNADAGIGGDLFYLCFYEHDNDTVVLYDWDKVLGLYQQGGKEYVLVQDFPGDRCYSEDEQSLIDAYIELINTIDNVVIKTDNMTGYLECGIEDLDWVQYESDWERNE